MKYDTSVPGVIEIEALDPTETIERLADNCANSDFAFGELNEDCERGELVAKWLDVYVGPLGWDEMQRDHFRRCYLDTASSLL